MQTWSSAATACLLEEDNRADLTAETSIEARAL
jgi:hypothetical protein